MSGPRKRPVEPGTATSPVADLEARAADLAHGITAAKAQLRQALVTGASTAAIRAELETLENQATAVTMALAETRAERQRQEAAEVEQAAVMTATESARRLLARLATIRIPPRPARGGG